MIKMAAQVMAKQHMQDSILNFKHINDKMFILAVDRKKERKKERKEGIDKERNIKKIRMVPPSQICSVL